MKRGTQASVLRQAGLRTEGRSRHRGVAPSRMHRRVEVRDLARMVRIVDVEHTQAGQDERARDDARVVSLRNGAVVSGVPLERAARPGITGDLRTVLRRIDLE